MIVSTIPGHSYFINSPVDGTVSTADGSVQLLAFKAGVQVDFSAPSDAVRVLPDDSRIIVRENFKSAPARAAAPAGAEVTPAQITEWDASARKWSDSKVEIGQDADVGSVGVAAGFRADAPCVGGVAIGAHALAYNNAVAAGYCALAYGEGSVAVGAGTAVAGDRGVLVGWYAGAETDSVSIGYHAQATSGNIAIGADSLACAGDTTVLGTCAYAMANLSTVVGAEAQTSFENNVLIGAKTRSNSSESVAVGTYATVGGGGYGSVVVGSHARVPGGKSVVVGSSSSLEGFCAEGTLVGPDLSPPAHVGSFVPIAMLGAGSTCTSRGQLAVFFYRKAGDVFMGFQTIDGMNSPVYKEVSMTRLFNMVQ